MREAGKFGPREQVQYIWSFREREVAVAVLSLLCEGCLEIEQFLQEVSHSTNASVTSPTQELSVRDRGLVGGEIIPT